MDKFLSYITDKRAKLAKQVQKLQAEIAKLDEAERLYLASGATAQDDRPELELAPFTRENPFPGKGTIKERVLAILEQSPQGLTSSQLLEKLNQTGLPNLRRESLSPQLTRLKVDEHVILDNGLWFRLLKP